MTPRVAGLRHRKRRWSCRGQACLQRDSLVPKALENWVDGVAFVSPRRGGDLAGTFRRPALGPISGAPEAPAIPHQNMPRRNEVGSSTTPSCSSGSRIPAVRHWPGVGGMRRLRTRERAERNLVPPHRGLLQPDIMHVPNSLKLQAGLSVHSQTISSAVQDDHRLAGVRSRAGFRLPGGRKDASVVSASFDRLEE